jgi:hypothetical protein
MSELSVEMKGREEKRVLQPEIDVPVIDSLL